MIHDPVFHIGVLDVHPFGLFVAIGMILAYGIALWQARRAGLPTRHLPAILVIVGPGSFIAARLGYVAQHPDAARHGLADILALWRGGLSLPAGILGGILLLALYTWSQQQPFWRWADVLAPGAALGIVVGQLAAPYSNPPEGWGQPTQGPFFMRVDPSVLPMALVNADKFHPIFAYEAVLFGVLALVLLALSWRQQRIGRPLPGVIGLVFLLVAAAGYGALRPLTLDAFDPALVMHTQLGCALLAAIALGLLVPRLWRSHNEAEITREIERVRATSNEQHIVS